MQTSNRRLDLPTRRRLRKSTSPLISTPAAATRHVIHIYISKQSAELVFLLVFVVVVAVLYTARAR